MLPVTIASIVRCPNATFLLLFPVMIPGVGYPWG